MATVEVEISEESTKVQKGFLALALAGDNTARASETCGINERTLRYWRQKYREEYDRIRRDLAPRLEQVVVAEQYAFVLEAGRAKRLALQKTMEALEADAIPARDLPGALKSITTAEAISVDKILALSGRPTSVVEHRSANDIVRKLAALGAVTDATAVELPEETSPAA